MGDPREEKISFDFEVEVFEDHEDRYEGESQDGTAHPSAVPTSSAPTANASAVPISSAPTANTSAVPTYDKVKECIMYNFGFCPNGPNCRYKHNKLPGPPPPVEETLKTLQRHQASENNFKHPQASENNFKHPQIIETSNSRAPGLLEGTSRYFIIKSNNLDNLQLSVERDIWATLPKNESILNEAFDACDNVVLIFSVNQAHHFHGCAKMTSKIGAVPDEATWNDGRGQLKKFGKNFGVKWLKRCELPFQKTRHLSNPLNENLPVQISRDCQELEPSVGKKLTSMLLLENDVNFWQRHYGEHPMPKRRKMRQR